MLLRNFAQRSVPPTFQLGILNSTYRAKQCPVTGRAHQGLRISTADLWLLNDANAA